MMFFFLCHLLQRSCSILWVLFCESFRYQEIYNSDLVDHSIQEAILIRSQHSGSLRVFQASNLSLLSVFLLNLHHSMNIQWIIQSSSCSHHLRGRASTSPCAGRFQKRAGCRQHDRSNVSSRSLNFIKMRTVTFKSIDIFMLSIFCLRKRLTTVSLEGVQQQGFPILFL